ncbi:hypothetical protein CBL_14539 [Carabus blaptoides fortunei]
MDQTSASGQNVKEAENTVTNKSIEIVDGPSTSGLSVPRGQQFTTTPRIDIVAVPSTSGLSRSIGRKLTTFKKIDIIDLPSFSDIDLPTERDFATFQSINTVRQSSTYGLNLQAGEDTTTHRNIKRLDQPSTSGFNLQAGDSTTTHRSADIMVQSSKPGLNEKLAKCSLSTVEHFNTPTMSTTQPGVRSKIPVAVRKSKKDEGFAKTMDSDHFKVETRVCDTIKELPEPMFSDEEEEAYEKQMSNVCDVQVFHERFTTFYERMRDLNQSLYETFGMSVEYNRLHQQLINFLGELCYYREKRE